MNKELIKIKFKVFQYSKPFYSRLYSQKIINTDNNG